MIFIKYSAMAHLKISHVVVVLALVFGSVGISYGVTIVERSVAATAPHGLNDFYVYTK